MIDHTTALYCITDDLLKAVGHRNDRRRELTDAEVITTALVAALYLGGNIERTRRFKRGAGLMPRMLSRSRLCRRLHAVADLAYTLFQQLGSVLKGTWINYSLMVLTPSLRIFFFATRPKLHLTRHQSIIK